jgi:hypothetical protein
MVESGTYFLCLQGRIRNILPLSSGWNQEYTSSVFRIESGIYFLCLRGRSRNILPLSSG